MDVRSDGGFVVAWPSKHVSGALYRWTRNPRDHGVADLPEAWARAMARPGADCRPVERGDGTTTAWGRRRLEAQVELVLAAVSGRRNDTLNGAAFKVGQAVASGHIAPAAAVTALSVAASTLGADFTETEAQKTILSGLRAGWGNPVGPSPLASE